jgi:hypothetical protein
VYHLNQQLIKCSMFITIAAYFFVPPHITSVACAVGVTYKQPQRSNSASISAIIFASSRRRRSGKTSHPTVSTRRLWLLLWEKIEACEATSQPPSKHMSPFHIYKESEISA